MAKTRQEMMGEGIAYLARLIPVAILSTKDLEMAIREMNPFKERRPESEAMQAHKAKLAAMRFGMGRGA